MAGEFTSSTFYDEVRVPAANLVGDENQGWKLITNQLNHERVAICPVSGILRSITDVRAVGPGARPRPTGVGSSTRSGCRSTWPGCRPRPSSSSCSTGRWRGPSDKGLNPADASATKVFGTEFALEAYRLLLEIVGQAGYLAEGSPGAVLRGRLERQARSQTIFTFGGGTNEIQRDIIAMIGLGMPRAPR